MPRGDIPTENRARLARNSSWNTGKMISSQGYVRLRVGRDHPLSDGNGYAYEHLVIWCAAGNQRPPNGYLLPHKNEERTDNRLENLELLTRKAHNQQHRANHPRASDGTWISTQVNS